MGLQRILIRKKTDFWRFLSNERGGDLRDARSTSVWRDKGGYNPDLQKDKMNDRQSDRRRMQTVFCHESLISIKFYKHQPVYHSSSRLSSLSLCSPLCVIRPRLKISPKMMPALANTTLLFLSSPPSSPLLSSSHLLAYFLPPSDFLHF